MVATMVNLIQTNETNSTQTSGAAAAAAAAARFGRTSKLAPEGVGESTGNGCDGQAIVGER